MKNTVLLFLSIMLLGIIGITSCETLLNDFEEDDDVMQIENGADYGPNYKRSIGGNIVFGNGLPELDMKHIINPPPMPCRKPCYKRDKSGKCRKIIECEEYS